MPLAIPPFAPAAETWPQTVVESMLRGELSIDDSNYVSSIRLGDAQAVQKSVLSQFEKSPDASM